MVVDGFYDRVRAQVVLLGIDGLGGGVLGRVTDADAVLDKPLVNGLGGMGHKDPPAEVCLGQHIRQRGGVIDMETMTVVSWQSIRLEIVGGRRRRRRKAEWEAEQTSRASRRAGMQWWREVLY